ncbi:zinc finger, CCHC-type containing protein [Tanacetum coccineum]
MIKSTKDMLKSKFDMKDMGLADVILGIKIIQTHNGLVLSQAHYVDKILNTHNAGDSDLARTPIDTNDDVVVLENSETKEEDVKEDESNHNKERYTFEDDDDDVEFDDLD